ncbi:hypothetical protein [Acinetobacter sp. ASP199]|uniref:hypothetical protein n=1 Tax=unclassified Acinetobacter TaxID=196816 RepID=UPI001F601017|nr:hypothetical protein [Acinetobacter sp. ASP199]UNT59567.1 hypothetical protein IHE35_01670 [Acinetobacter sp. ASP199]
MHFLIQPLRQTKTGIAVQLLLAPVLGLAALYGPFMFVLLILHLLFLAMTSSSLLLSMVTFMLIMYIFGLLFYLCLIYIPLCISLFLLHHLRQFHIFSIVVVGILGTLILAYALSSDDLLSTLFMISCFSLPSVGFFIFLSLCAHEQAVSAAE